MIIVHYEVYVLEGRGWMLHARFPRTERETAIAEAKELEHTLNVRVKVVRETYYTDTNAFDEAEIYLSGGKLPDKPKPSAAPASKPAASRPSGGGSGGGGKPAAGKPAPVRKAAAPPPRRSPPRDPEDTAKARQLMARLLGICALSLAVAFLSIKLTPNLILLLWKMGFSVSVTPQGYGQLLFAVFVLTFLMTAVPLSMKFLPRNARMPQFNRPSLAFGSAGGGSVAAPSTITDPKLKKSLDKLASEALREEEKKPAAEEEDDKDSDLPELPDDDLPPLEDRGDEDLPEISPDPEADKKEKEKEKQKKEEKKEESGGISAESQMPAVKKFLKGAMDAARSSNVQLDTYNKFALHLYMAGAVQSLCNFRKIGNAGKDKLMDAALDGLGTRGETASNFISKLSDYLRENRYASVFEAGQNAMGNFLLGDEAGAHLGLPDVYKAWNRKGGEQAKQLMTVLFTDMVGSTDLTQARGDDAAQEIVRRHNLIVRGALQKFGGKEVKHTGDGIMASFYSAGDAIDAMILVQRQVAEHNHRMPTQELHLRIGLNAGEPIQEEDDLFGSTVQLSARVCAATESDEILCTASVVEHSGKPAGFFRLMGEKHLKGFKDPIALYQVPWR